MITILNTARHMEILKAARVNNSIAGLKEFLSSDPDPVRLTFVPSETSLSYNVVVIDPDDSEQSRFVTLAHSTAGNYWRLVR